MQALAEREMRMVDTAIITGLQNGTAFFASTSLLAIGAGFALLNSTDLALQISHDLNLPVDVSRGLWEVKVLALITLYIYAFFKFGWAYRLFNYASILIGAFPPPDKDQFSRDAVKPFIRHRKQTPLLVAISTEACGHSSFPLALFAWFIHPLLFIGTSNLYLRWFSPVASSSPDPANLPRRLG